MPPSTLPLGSDKPGVPKTVELCQMCHVRMFGTAGTTGAKLAPGLRAVGCD
jgi:hypothetical protein